MISWPGRERDEVGEPLDRDGVAVADELGDRRRASSRPSYGSSRPTASLAASTPLIAPAASPLRRTPPCVAGDRSDRLGEDPQGGRHLRLGTVSAGDIRTLDLPHSRTSRPRWKHGPLDLLGVLGRVELDAEHQALAADVADEPSDRSAGAAAARRMPARRAPRRCRSARPRAGRSSRGPRRRRPGCHRTSSRARRGPMPRGGPPARPSRRAACRARCPWRSAGCRA